jgi:hypothetical protein
VTFTGLVGPTICKNPKNEPRPVEEAEASTPEILTPLDAFAVLAGADAPLLAAASAVAALAEVKISSTMSNT